MFRLNQVLISVLPKSGRCFTGLIEKCENFTDKKVIQNKIRISF